MVNSVRRALRNLSKAPGYTLTAVLTLAVGLTAVGVMFTIIETVILHPLSFPGSDRIVTVSQRVTSQGPEPFVASLAEFLQWKNLGVFRRLAAVGTSHVTLLGKTVPQQLDGVAVTPEFFSVFKMRPLIGEWIGSEGTEPADSKVIVLSYSIWKTSFGGDPNIIGKIANTGVGPLTIIGVMPPNFDFPKLSDVRNLMSWAPEHADFWIPLRVTQKLIEEDNFDYYIVGRLGNSATVPVAKARCQLAAVQLFRKSASILGPWANEYVRSLEVNVEPLQESMTSGVRERMWMLFSAVSLLLILVMFNLGTLQLTRHIRRLRETTIQEALGATRWRILREHCVEPIVIVLGATVVSLAAQVWTINLVRKALSATIPRINNLHFDWTVVGILFLLSVGVALIFSALPMLIANNAPIAQVLQSDSRTSINDRHANSMKSGLLVIEIAISTVLMTGSLFFVQSYRQTLQVNPGFDANHLWSMTVTADQETDSSLQAQLQRIESIRRAIEEIPGVESATITNDVPFTGGQHIHNVRTMMGQQPVRETKSAEYWTADNRYFQTLRIPVVSGRTFGRTERPNVAIVNARMANLLWPDQNAIGKQFQDGDNPPLTVVGIVGNIHDVSLEQTPQMQFYVPIAANPRFSNIFIVRTDFTPRSLISQLRRAVARVDSTSPVSHLRAITALFGATILERRLETWLVTAFACIAILLTMVGLFGIVALSVASRTREFGVRLAFGATSGDLIRLEISRALRLVLTGAAIGMGTSLALAKVMEAFLFGVSPWNAYIYGLSLASVMLFSLLSLWLPARHVATVDAAVALRGDA